VFGLFRKKKTIPLSGLVDFHNHLVPGIDDGALSEEESLAMMQHYVDAGYTTVCVSSHLHHPMFPDVTVEAIRQGVQRLRELATEAQLPLKLEVGAEHFVSDHFLEGMESGDLLPVADGKYLLVEFSLHDPMMHMKELAFQLSVKGYHPILAHPERYPTLQRKPELAEEWRQAGWHFQLNLATLISKSGLKKLAKRWLKQSHYDLAATDLHHTPPYEGWLTELTDELQRLTSHEEANRLLITNPKRLLTGQPMLRFFEDD
jgi:protein-tyrosine phosphatase